VLDAWWRLRRTETLTVLLFHRVLPKDAAELANTDPPCAISVDLFRECLLFLRDRCNAIGIDDLLSHLDGRRRLPTAPLLLTFDDGWSDTAEFALPVLTRLGLPSTIFVTSDAVESSNPVWWQDDVASALRSTRMCESDALDLLTRVGRDGRPWRGPSPEDHNIFLALIAALASRGTEERDALLAPFRQHRPVAHRQMLRPDQLTALRSARIGLACHSAAHLPLTLLSDDEIAADLMRCRDTLVRWAGEPADSIRRCLAFPHGRYDDRVVAAARQAGFDLLFGTEACINALPEPGRPALLNRIPMSTAAVSGTDGTLRPDRLATWLFTRPRRSASLPGGLN